MTYEKTTRSDNSVHFKIVKDDGGVIDFILNPTPPYNDAESFEAFHNGNTSNYTDEEKTAMINEQLTAASIATQLIALFISDPNKETEFVNAMIPHPGGSWFVEFCSLNGIS